MSSYFFAIAGKQIDETVPSNLGRSLACQVALRIYNHNNAEVGVRWEQLMERLASVNLGIVRQLYNDVSALAGTAPLAPDSVDSPARIERTRAYLADMIRRFENEK